MDAKTVKQNKAEFIVVGIAVIAFVLGLVAHFGYIAAPMPLILGVIFLISYKIAEAGED